MPDLTRFDFHINKFLSSEDVKRMDSSEVGQYILLLCDAWSIGKEATLPNDPKYLARIARVVEVSPLVMSKFFMVEMECGARLRNERLYKEWVAAMNRFTAAQERSQKGNNARWGYKTPSGNPARNPQGFQQASPKSLPNHYQPNPDQIISKEEIQKAFAASDEKVKRENAEIFAKKKELDDLAEEFRGQF